MSIVDIFPTPIGIYELDRNFAESEIKFIENLQWEEHIGNYGSVNTNLLVLDNKIYSKFLLKIV